MTVVTLQQVILLTGRHDINDREVRVVSNVMGDNRFGLVMAWKPTSFPYFRLKFSVGGKPVKAGSQSYLTMAQELGLQGAWAIAPPDCQVACVLQPNVNDVLMISGWLDTNDPDFRREAEKIAPGQQFAIRLKGYLLGAGNQSETFDLYIAATPAAPAEWFPGTVGLDLGNHNSTIAAYRRRDPENPILIQEGSRSTKAIASATAKPTLSTVYIKTIGDGQPHDSLDSILWDIGDLASMEANTSMDGIELAAKKLIASPRYKQTKAYRVSNNHKVREMVDVPLECCLPGELLACRLLHQFREATRSFPQKLAVSYPTMFSEREVLQLREVIHRAWLRMTPRRQDEAAMMPIHRPFVGPAQLTDDDEGILLLLDEASAAAFFFLFQRILQTHGQLARFRYLYPHGLNLLLFDCGGGTTDIALVRAIVRPANPRCLVLTVRGRLGRKDFGGQFITEAVYRVLKAKAANLLNPAVRTVPSGDGVSREKLEAYFKQNAEAIDRVIPTKFTRAIGDDSLSADARKRLQRSMTLWKLADKLKIDLAAATNGRATVDQSEWQQLDIPGVDANTRAKLKGLSIHRNEVDALVGERLSETIQICNDLILQKLVQKDHTGIEQDHLDAEEVHWVVAAGAACRYPLVTERLKQELNVPFLKSEDSKFSESRMTVDDDNLKHAVAKGLARVLLTKDMQVGITVSFDSELSQRLPFEVVYLDALGIRKILFRENTHVEVMTESRSLFPQVKRVERVTEEEERLGNYVILYRRFPGENKDTAYLQYYFRDGVEGELKVRYEKQVGLSGTGRSPFVMTNEVTYEEGDCTDLTPEESYLHPVQRGDL